MSSSGASFDLSTVFHAVATTIPDPGSLIWRDLDLTCHAQMDARIDGIARLDVAGAGLPTERDQLRGHQSGQDHMGLYLRSGSSTLEAMVAGYRAQVAPFNVNYRYVEEGCSCSPTRRPGRWCTRGVRPERRLHPRPAALADGADPGGRRHR